MSSRGSIAKLSKKLTLASRDGLRCAYCSEELTLKSATLDHFVPLAQGGSWANPNLRIACNSCNQRKGAMPPQKWLALSGLSA